jgi:hypothetical protein
MLRRVTSADTNASGWGQSPPPPGMLGRSLRWAGVAVGIAVLSAVVGTIG